MGRKATGTVYVQGGRFKALIPLADGSRWPVDLKDPGLSRAAAKALAAQITEHEKHTGELLAAKRLRQPAPAVGGESLAGWLDRWFADRDARGLQTKADRGRIRSHVPELLLSRPIASVTKSDVEGLVEILDGKVRDGVIKWKSAMNAWAVVSKAFDDAANAKTRALRVLASNPAAGVRGPDRGARTAKQYLYPSELLAVVSHPDVPIAWARNIALGAYLYMRPGELEALEWEDVDLDRGIVHVHRAIDREHGGTKPTKTDTPRRFAVEPVLLPLLVAMHKETGGKGRVTSFPSETNYARAFRTLLGRAGVDRAELHEPTPTRKAITFYDLRATGVTWRIIRGDDPMKVMSAAGHRDFHTTQGYIREAEALREGFGDVFPPLPARLLAESSQIPSHRAQVRGIKVPKEGLEPSHPCG